MRCRIKMFILLVVIFFATGNLFSQDSYKRTFLVGKSYYYHFPHDPINQYQYFKLLIGSL